MCDKNITLALKGSIHSVVIIIALLYDAECWSINKTQVLMVMVPKMRIICEIYDHTRLDRIRNEVIRDKVGVTSIK